MCLNPDNSQNSLEVILGKTRSTNITKLLCTASKSGIVLVRRRGGKREGGEGGESGEVREVR